MYSEELSILHFRRFQLRIPRTLFDSGHGKRKRNVLGR
jgi:hypothetical protein